MGCCPVSALWLGPLPDPHVLFLKSLMQNNAECFQNSPVCICTPLEDGKAAEWVAAIWNAKPQKLKSPQNLGRTFRVLEHHLLVPRPLAPPPALQGPTPAAPLWESRTRATFSPAAELLPYAPPSSQQVASDKWEQQTDEARAFPQG